MIQIYTGDGKGKTTAAAGLAMRARGQGLRVGVIYFHKDLKRWESGEVDNLKRLGADIFEYAKEHPHFHKNVPHEAIREGCLEAVDFIRHLFREKRYEMVVLDEILISVRDGFLKEEELLDLLREKPEATEVVLTGRGATEKLKDRADLVSEIKKIKHPCDRGIKARKGIEF